MEYFLFQVFDNANGILTQTINIWKSPESKYTLKWAEPGLLP